MKLVATVDGNALIALTAAIDEMHDIVKRMNVSPRAAIRSFGEISTKEKLEKFTIAYQKCIEARSKL